MNRKLRKAVRTYVHCLATGAVSLTLAPALSLAQEAPSSGGEPAGALEEVVVTGTLIRGIAPAGSNLLGLSQDEAEASGGKSTSEIISALPQVSNMFNQVPAGVSAVAGSNGSNPITKPNLRALPAANTSGGPQTLVLLDGHRVVGAGTQQIAIDPDIFAPNVIARVDAMTDGGSAVYGSDALGGVLNFITLDSYDGIKVSGRVGIGDEYESYDGGILAGTSWGSGSTYVAYNYGWHSDILGKDRGFVKNIDWETGIPAGRNCAEPNVVTGGTNYVVAGNSLEEGTSICDPSDYTAIYPKATTQNVFAKISQDLSDNISLDVTALWADRETTGLTGALGSGAGAGSGGAVASVRIEPDNPNYIDAGNGRPQNITFNYGPYAGPGSESQLTELDTWSIAPNLRIGLGAGWAVNLLASYGESEVTYRNRVISAVAQAEAMANGSLNPYNILDTDPAVLDEITGGLNRGYGKNEEENYRAIFDGPVFDISGGEVSVAIGAEYRENTFEQRITSAATLELQDPIDYTQRVTSAFGEIVVPLVSDANALSWAQEITASISVRYDDYNDFGDTTNPKIGLTYRPVDWIALRGSWGESFNAPTAVDQLGPNSSSASLIPAAFLQAPPGVVVEDGDVGIFLGGGSVDGLLPQEAETWSVGFTLDPPVLPGLTVDISYYEIELEGTLGRPVTGAVLDDYYANFPQLSIGRPSGVEMDAFIRGALRNPDNLNFIFDNPGSTAPATVNGGTPVVAVLDTLVRNLGSYDLAGIDFSTSYFYDSDFASFDFRIAGNYRLKQDSQALPGAPVMDELETGQSKYKVSTTVGMTKGNLRAQATWRYSDGWDRAVPEFGQDRIDDFDIVDLFFRYEMNGSGLTSDLYFTFLVQNVFDDDPVEVRVNGQPGYDANAGFTLGRVFQFGATKEF